MSKDKLLLSFLLTAGTICGTILFIVFSHREDREFNSILNQCREKLERVEELLKEV